MYYNDWVVNSTNSSDSESDIGSNGLFLTTTKG